MTKLLLIRHGHVEGIAPPRFRGRADLPLTELGEKQARATARRVAAEWRPALVYASPLTRTIATARPIAAASGVEVKVMPGLIDIDYGVWQGLTLDEVRSRWPEEARWWYCAPQLAEIPGGETVPDVFARASRSLGEILRLHPEQTVAIVSHDAVVRLILVAALELPLSRDRHFVIAPCSITELEFGDWSFKVGRLNDTAHLPPSSP